MGAERDSSFGAFVVSHRSSLLRTAFLLTGDRGLAEDLVQSALVRTFRHWRRVEGQEPLAYVRRALVNGHVSWLRRRSSHEQVWDVLPDRAAPELADAGEQGEQVRALLQTLPPRMRTTLVLRYFEDLGEAETARLMGCSVSAVKTQSARGLQRLRVGLAGLADDRVGER